MQKQTSKKQKTNSKKPKVESISQTIEDKQYSKSLKGLLRALKDNKKERAKEIFESLSEKEQNEIFKHIENSWHKDFSKEKRKIIGSILSLVVEINREKIKQNPKGNEKVGTVPLNLFDIEPEESISIFLKYLIKGVNVNKRYYDNWTFLHNVVSMDNLYFFEFLFAETSIFDIIKPLIYLKDNSGKTILGIAIDYNSLETLDYLEEIGYNPFVGKVMDSTDLEEYFIFYENLISRIKTKKDINEILEENPSFNKEVFELGLALYFAENCDERLSLLIK